jgi:hypothetical protein
MLHMYPTLLHVVLPITPITASVISIDPVVSGKHIGASQPIEADWQHPYEKTASASCSVYRFNNYEHRCRVRNSA